MVKNGRIFDTKFTTAMAICPEHKKFINEIKETSAAAKLFEIIEDYKHKITKQKKLI